MMFAGDELYDDDATSGPCHLPRWFNVRTGMCEHTDHDEPVTDLHLDDMSCCDDDDNGEGCGKWGCKECYPDADSGWEDDGAYDNDPSPYLGTYSED